MAHADINRKASDSGLFSDLLFEKLNDDGLYIPDFKALPNFNINYVVKCFFFFFVQCSTQACLHKHKNIKFILISQNQLA